MLAKCNSIIKGYMSILLLGLTLFDEELDSFVSSSNYLLNCLFIVLRSSQ